MKKQFTLSALCLTTLIGGSWLAAQQRESLRTTGSLGGTLAPLTPPQPPVDDNIATRPPEAPDLARRATGGARTINRSGQNNNLAEVNQLSVPTVYGSYVPNVLGMPQPRMSPEDAARMREFQDAIRELRSAENDEDKAAAREQVTKLVSEQLDSDLANREKELAAIEQRAKELRKQLDERKSSKPEMLKMLVMLIDNPQVGLGIPQEWMHMLMRGPSNGSPQNNYQSFQNSYQSFIYPAMGWDNAAGDPTASHSYSIQPRGLPALPEAAESPEEPSASSAPARARSSR